MSLLGIDVGSSSCKGVAFDVRGRMLARASSAYSPASPGPGMFEIDAECFWRAVVEVTRTVAGQVAGDPIEALAISSHGETFMPVNTAGTAIAPAIMNADSRALEQSDRWETTLGRGKIYAITGLPLHPMWSLNKIMWLKQHNSGLFARAARFVSVGDYILLRMGLPAVTDYSLAGRTLAFDIRRKTWSAEILEIAGVREDKLPEPIASGQLVGKLSPAAATVMGLAAGTIVATGGHDQPCGALGSGVIGPGDVSDSAGTYECMTAASREPRNSARALSFSLNSYCHVVPGRYVTLAFFPAGVAVRWFVEQFCGDDAAEAQLQGVSVYDLLAERIPDGPTGLCITPHFIGSCNPYWDVRATGVIAGLTPGTTKYHIYKAIYEGIACELAINAEVLEDVCGTFKRITISGGGAASPFTVHLRAALTGKRLRTVQTADTVCLGAAMLAGMAAGIFKNAEDAVRQMVPPGRIVEPDAAVARQYDRQLRQYRLIFPALAQVRAQ